jgi:hypothetical protein
VSNHELCHRIDDVTPLKVCAALGAGTLGREWDGKKLNLANNKLGDDAGIAIATNLTTNNVLKGLQLDDNLLACSAGEAIGRMLPSNVWCSRIRTGVCVPSSMQCDRVHS